jgi:cilia- and flagella-associated protein 300
LSVELFDRLFEKNIVRESGHIRGCFDEYYEDIQISDELRKLLLIEESDNYEIYSQNERNQFLFKLFKHLCLGGQVCQFEETVQPYIDVTKSIYKELISVTKDPNTKAIKTVSYVFKVEAFVSNSLSLSTLFVKLIFSNSKDENNKKYFPNDTIIEQDFCYIIIEPYKRQLVVLYHRFDGIMEYE